MTWNGLTPNSFWFDKHRLLFSKDCRSMADLPNELVQMVVTSPPYWGLRKYVGLPDLIWGGDEGCGHQWQHDLPSIKGHKAGETNPGKEGYTKNQGAWANSSGSFCSLCGAWKGQLGLEPTPELYISNLVQIFREVRRVLRSDGVVFLNIGDSYFGGGNNRGNNSPISDKQASNFGAVGQCAEHQKNIGKHPTIKPKDLCLIPFRLAIALQDDGWWVRSVIIWNKPNPMPESVTDRPTESHEYILMLTKSDRYYFDSYAVRETGVVDRFDGSGKSLVFGDGFGFKNTLSEKSLSPSSVSHNRLGEIAIHIASSILDCPQFKTDESLRFLDSEIRKQGIDNQDSRPIADCPRMTRAAVLSSALLVGDMTAKSFLEQLKHLKISVADCDNFGIRWVIPFISNTPFTGSDTDTTLAVNNPSQISQHQLPIHYEEYSIGDVTLSNKTRGMKRKGRGSNNPELGNRNFMPIQQEQHHGQDIFPQSGGRNLRSVWTINTQPYKFAHFATYPEKLVELCVKAATPEVGCCSKCGRPWARVTDATYNWQTKSKTLGTKQKQRQQEFGSYAIPGHALKEVKTLGWKAQCKCNLPQSENIESIVLDPFAGSGTTLKVAAELNRRAIGYELSEQYCNLAVERNRQGVFV